MLPLVPLDKSRPVLADRAGEMVRQFGYAQPLVDAASGFEYDSDFLTWLAQRERTLVQRKTLPVGQPSAVQFWYRASPSVMVPYQQDRKVSYSDPPLQQMPSHDEEIAAIVRSAFLPDDGEVWASCDQSQQEFR